MRNSNINQLLKRALNGERLSDISIIDHHGHFCLTQGMALEDEVKMIVHEMDNCGISKSVVFNLDEYDYINANDKALQGISLFPDRFIGYAFVHLKHGVRQAVKELARCKDRGMKGLKLHCAYMDEPSFMIDEFNDIWEFCAENAWPVIIHGLPIELPEKHPKTTFVGAHHIEKINDQNAITKLQECPNYYWCTSATLCLKGAIEKMVSLGLSDKLLFGSDFPLNSISIRLGSILGAEIPENDMKNILGGNIKRLLKLEREIV